MPSETPRLRDTRGWLSKADLDVHAARIDIDAYPPLLEDASFHCQQAVEKALKAFLTWHDQPFRRTHDLNELGRQVTAIEPELEPLLPGRRALRVRLGVSLPRGSTGSNLGRGAGKLIAGSDGGYFGSRPDTGSLTLIRGPCVSGLSLSPSEASVDQLKVGDRAPDFALPDHLGALVRLSDVLDQRNVMLVFNLGFV